MYLLNKVADAEIEYQLWQRLLGAGLHATAVIRDDPHIRAAWLEGSPLESASALAEAAKLVRALEEGFGAFVGSAPAEHASAGTNRVAGGSTPLTASFIPNANRLSSGTDPRSWTR